MVETLYAIVPFIDLPSMTTDAIEDLLKQKGVNVRVLAISNGSSPETRLELEARFKCKRERVLFWWHHPPLLSLDASWNAGLDFVWATGATRAFVVNNDVRLAKWTAATLSRVIQASNAYFVSAVGVTEEQFKLYQAEGSFNEEPYPDHGGPDFSCFMISRECHLRYRLDENFTYCGDLDYHRTLMLGGDASKIFSVNVPYLHYASQTIKRASPEKQEHFRLVADMHHQRYIQKWGGDCNSEKFLVPYSEEEHEGVTTPELQARG